MDNNETVQRAYLPCLDRPTVNETSRDELIQRYFKHGFSYAEITIVLTSKHNLNISLRQLKRHLHRLGLRRRPIGAHISRLENVIPIIFSEMQNSGSCLGYRAIWRRLVIDHGLRVNRDLVLQIMRIFDPEGVAGRKARRLRRRQYICPGPNYVWHVDGYDKLKPFGFAIHGCIDGFSRRIMWLQVSTSNNDPAIITTYYLNTIKQLGVVPKLLRCDFGTANTTLCKLQPFFNYVATDPDACLQSFLYGKSTSNQRIEAWWAMLRRHGGNWWINLFKDLRDSNSFHDANPLHIECLSFCFMDVLQTELERISKHWNLHPISKSRNEELPRGKPDVLYFTPEMYNTGDYGNVIDQTDVALCAELYGTDRNQQVCSAEFVELVILMKPNLVMPKTADEALALYLELTDGFVDYTQ